MHFRPQQTSMVVAGSTYAVPQIDPTPSAQNNSIHDSSVINSSPLSIEDLGDYTGEGWAGSLGLA
ncbi:hypothetical protein AXF42_Ash016076 [Apostasia shenzhenica]|uniref:Uncharacterized protein n=1 Tax=Apostasia shenzhenica TaxID=1088818 RepID=A0A2I0B3B7_9ASPA|nr:hypothetical protein AXF42_Ash016076 [Apostasia shenzhenica]